jgi:hypothetical protein
MKLRSAPLDDVYSELVFVLSGDGRLLARVLLSIARTLYRWHRRALLAVLRVLNRGLR